MTEKMEDEVSKMGGMGQMIFDKGKKEGLEEGKKEGIDVGVLASLKKLTKNLGVSCEEAMRLLEVPKDDQSRFTEMLAKS